MHKRSIALVIESKCASMQITLPNKAFENILFETRAAAHCCEILLMHQF